MYNENAGRVSLRHCKLKDHLIMALADSVIRVRRSPHHLLVECGSVMHTRLGGYQIVEAEERPPLEPVHVIHFLKVLGLEGPL